MRTTQPPTPHEEPGLPPAEPHECAYCGRPIDRKGRFCNRQHRALFEALELDAKTELPPGELERRTAEIRRGWTRAERRRRMVGPAGQPWTVQVVEDQSFGDRNCNRGLRGVSL